MLRSAYRLLRKIKSRFVRIIFTYFIQKQVASYGKNLTVNGPSNLNKDTILGNNVNLNGFKVSGRGKLVVGHNFHSGKECLVITQNHNYEGSKIPYDENYDISPVTIEDNVWFGHRVIVLPGVSIGEGAIIQAGSTVVDDVTPGAIVGGCPAEKFAERDMNHYERLKQSGKTH